MTTAPFKVWKKYWIRDSVIGFGMVALVIMGCILSLLTPVGWLLVIWLSSLPVRVFSDHHFTLGLLGAWPHDWIGCFQLAVFWTAAVIIPVFTLAAITAWLRGWIIHRSAHSD